jgi:hypothetical protein
MKKKFNHRRDRKIYSTSHFNQTEVSLWWFIRCEKIGEICLFISNYWHQIFLFKYIDDARRVLFDYIFKGKFDLLRIQRAINEINWHTFSHSTRLKFSIKINRKRSEWNLFSMFWSVRYCIALIFHRLHENNDPFQVVISRAVPTGGAWGITPPLLLKFAFNNCENLDFIPTTLLPPALSVSVRRLWWYQTDL